jgi:hypothetical protein
VGELLRGQRKPGEVGDWVGPYAKELTAVRDKRLRRVTEEEVRAATGGTGIAVRLRMLMEVKRDLRKKCRLILQGFREPREWDGGVTDSRPCGLHGDHSVDAVSVWCGGGCYQFH